MNINKLKEIFEASNSKYEDCKSIGVSYQHMYNIIHKERPFRTDLLEKIAKFYKVPVGYFFDETGVEANTSRSDMEHELQFLRGQVAAYEKTLSMLGEKLNHA